MEPQRSCPHVGDYAAVEINPEAVQVLQERGVVGIHAVFTTNDEKQAHPLFHLGLVGGGPVVDVVGVIGLVGTGSDIG